MARQIANKAKTKKGNPNWQKGGASPNPAGRPSAGESWAEIIKRIGAMTGEEASVYVAEFAKHFRPFKAVTLKEAVVLRCFTALLFEPQASMVNALMDRAEGKVAETHKHTGTMAVMNVNSDLDDKTEAQVKHDLNTFAAIATRLAGGISESSQSVQDEDSAGPKRRKAHAGGG